MNTQYIKKDVIAKKLGELFENTCKYSPATMARWDKMEPHGLAEFRAILTDLAERHFQNNLTIWDIESAQAYVWSVGSLYGHCTGSYTTGTWGVRYSTLDDIIKILKIGDFNLSPVGGIVEYYDQKYTIKSGYSVNSSFLTVKAQSIDFPELGEFDMCVEYNHIHIFKMGDSPTEAEINAQMDRMTGNNN